MTRTIRVELPTRGYDVKIGAGLLRSVGAEAAALRNVRRVVAVSDSTVAGLYGSKALESLSSAALRADLLSFPSGESNKTLAGVGKLFDGLFRLEPAVDRDCVIVALGGGVVGDMAGFLAATALRGLRWLQVPTTLLADVDASVGGKTAVDHAAGKNLIGAFHQPHGVLIDVETLRTLPPGELQSGLAECVKHAMIRDVSLLEFMENAADAILACEPRPMTELIARNVAIKAAVVAADEREHGQRAHLNFGHTVGHAIEACEGYGRVTHGQAVALGMIAACRLAEGKALLGASLRDRLEKLLARLGIEVRRRGLDGDAIWRIMQHDKKARGGKVRFVLPTGPGRVEVFDDVTEQQVKAAIASLE